MSSSGVGGLSIAGIGSIRQVGRDAAAYLQQACWVRWAVPVLIGVLFVLVEIQRVSVQIVARYPDFFDWAERASRFSLDNPAGLNWAHGLYPFGFPLLLWAGVQLGTDVLRMAFALSIFGGFIGLLGTFVLIRLLSGSYALAVVSEFVLACIGQYLYYASAESTDMLASGMLICALALLVYAGQRWRWSLAAGLVAGASYLIRYTSSLTILLCAVYLFALAVARRDRAWSIVGVAFLAGALLGGGSQLVASTIIKGNPFYSIQGHNLWFTLTGSIDYLEDWHTVPLEISMLEVFRQFPRQVLDHWWLEFSNFWMTSNVNFLGKPFYAFLQAGLLFVLLARNGLKGQARFFITVYAIGSLALYSFMRLDKRFLIPVMPLLVFGAVYFVWQLVPRDVQVWRRVIPVRWPVMLVLLAWSALYPWGFRLSNSRDVGPILASNVLHAAGMQSFDQVYSTELYLQDVADPWKRRFSLPALRGLRPGSYEELLDVLHEEGYRFFIYDQSTGNQLFPDLAYLQFPGSHPAGLAPIFVPKSGNYAIYRVLGMKSERYREFDVSLADGLHLIGYEGHLSEDQPHGSRQRLGVYLYWKADRAISNRLKVFVHMMNDKGELVAQDDSEPQLWFYPANEWEAGEIVCDFHSVSLAARLPAGTYSIRAGLYDGSTGQRVQVLDPGGLLAVENAVVLESFTVK